MARVWDVNWFGSTKTLDVHIRSLRKQARRRPRRPRRTSRRCAESASASPRRRLRRRKPASSPSAGARPTCCCWPSSRSASRWRSACATASTPRFGPRRAARRTWSRRPRRSSSATEDRATLERLAAISAHSVRGRVMVVSRSGRVIADSAGGATLGSSYAVAAGGRDRAPRRRLSGDAAQPDAGHGAPRHCRSGRPRRPHRRGGARHPERRGRQQRRAARDPRPGAARRRSCSASD